MGLLDQVLGGLMGGNSGGGSPLQGVLMSLLSGGQQQQPQPQGGYGGGASGGLSGLLGSLQQAGLGHIAESWIGNGPNQPISPQQLHSALGDDHVQSMSRTGRDGAARFPVPAEPASAGRRVTA